MDWCPASLGMREAWRAYDEMARKLSLLVFIVAISGCAHRVMLDSDPPGATIKMDGKMVGVTPTELKVRWIPFKRTRVLLKLPQRRAVTLDLHKDVGLMRIGWEVLSFQWGKLLGQKARTHHRTHFVKHHGPAGTWTPDDVR